MPASPPHVTVPTVNVQPLVGEWRGDYVANDPSGTHGTLAFALAAGNSDAHGTLTINAAGADRAFERYRSEQIVFSTEDATPGPDLPAIQFVRLEGSTVSGTVDAFVDPACQCSAIMTLSGKLQGDTIAGTFRATYNAQRPDLTGKWMVKRAAAATR
jgi:hypothetical protein